MAMTPEQIAITHQTVLGTTFAAAKTAFNFNASLAALSINTSHALLDDATSYTRTLLNAKSFDELSVHQLDQWQRLLKTAMDYSRSVYGVVMHGAGESVKPLEVQLSTANKIVARKIEKAVGSAPASSEAVATAVKSGLDAANNAFERARTAGKRAFELAGTNMTTASDAAFKVVKDTTEVVKKNKIA